MTGRIGRFLVEPRAQSGGMSVVFRGEDPSTGQHVAIKVLSQTAADDDDDDSVVDSRQRRNATIRFTREADLLASLRHDAIVRYLERGVDDKGTPFIVTEWLEGVTLAGKIARDRLSIPETFIVAERIAGALAYTHALGILHRDLKPANVMLVGGLIERATLIDFGLARQGASVLTREGSVMGTPGYMSPEQARGAAQVDARTDVFSLGCVLYRCLTGTLAFPGKDIYSRLRAVLMEEPPDVNDLRPDAPRALSLLVRLMLNKDPDHRPANGTAILEALGRIQTPSSETAPMAPGVVTLVLFSPDLGGDGPTLADMRAVSEPTADVNWTESGLTMRFREPGSLRERALSAIRVALALRRSVRNAHIMIMAIPAGGLVPAATLSSSPGIRLDLLTTQLVVDSELDLVEDESGAFLVDSHS